MGFNNDGQLGDGTSGQFSPSVFCQTNRPEQIVAIPPGYNQISVQLLSGGDVRLSFVGIAEANYALERSFSLTPPDWLPQVTNPADTGGMLVFTNKPDPTLNNFWRIRYVQ